MKDGLTTFQREAIREVLAEFPEVGCAVLFGSRAMGTWSPASDVDLALFGDALTLEDEARIAARMEDLGLPVNVDLVRHATIQSEALLEHIAREGREFHKGSSLGRPTRTPNLDAGGRSHSPSVFGEGTVGGLVTLQRGNTYSGKLVGEPGPALCGLGSIEPGGGFRPTKVQSFGGECPPKIMLRPGDLYVALKGATKDGSMVGSIARLPATFSSGRLTQDTARLDFLNPNREVANHLYWVLRTPQYRQYCAGRVTGSAAAAFSRNDFLSYPVPPITHAGKALVGVFEGIEAKIELNRMMNEALEAMARAIFQSWFVAFDPVHAKARGEQPLGMSDDVAALFPSEFEDSELGPIPKGWTPRSVYDCATFVNGAAFRNEHFSSQATGLPIIKIVELKWGITNQTKFTEDEFDSRYIVRAGDVLFSWSGSPETSIDIFVWTGTDGWLNQHIFNVGFNAPQERSFVYSMLRHFKPTFIAIAKNKQTTGLGHVTAQDLKRLRVAVPSSDSISAFDGVVVPILQRGYECLCESQTLSALRDTLLPRLISGQLRVPNAERLVCDAIE